MWEVEIRHSGLGKYRHIRGSDKYVVEQKAHFQQIQWDEQWQRKLDTEARALERQRSAEQRVREAQEKERLRSIEKQEKELSALEKARQKERSAAEKAYQKEESQRYKDSRKQEASDRDAAAKSAIEAMRQLLAHTLKVNDAINWNQLKDNSRFTEPHPSLVLPPSPRKDRIPSAPAPAIEPAEPIQDPYPDPPQRNSPKYRPQLTVFDKIIPARKKRKESDAQALFDKDYALWVSACQDEDQQFSRLLSNWHEEKKLIIASNVALHDDWKRTVESINAANIGRQKFWEGQCDLARSEHEKAVADRNERMKKFCIHQEEINKSIDTNRDNYLALDPGAVSDYCDQVLSNSSYPDFFPKQWDLDYLADSRTIVIDYQLPAPEKLPTIKEVQYIQTKDDFKETYLSDKERDAIYDDLIYQAAIRTLHEMFEADTAGALDAVVFNGIVSAIDKTSGHQATSCVLSVQARKEAFMQINLANIDPKACFKSLKGVAASKLSGLTPIAPVLMIDRNDRRFVNSYSVSETLDSGTNLASMDWEDFEHLIREVFEQEFATGGGEVKVTQASRDGGVDAVAFDPDPIRGGKIVIQAKRYTNTVGLSAVRDLYGTVINEGATKGVLVTTANYGPDAYEFAQGKPLSLLNGSNLLHLLEKHGHKARINLQEAKFC
jgi:restriction system protein